MKEGKKRLSKLPTHNVKYSAITHYSRQNAPKHPFNNIIYVNIAVTSVLGVDFYLRSPAVMFSVGDNLSRKKNATALQLHRGKLTWAYLFLLSGFFFSLIHRASRRPNYKATPHPHRQ